MKVISSPSIASRIEMAFQSASSTTGTDFDYLVKTAERESNFNTTAKARTSSATGLFQFIESTWLETLKQAGPEHGLGDYAKDIKQNKNGKYYVADGARRREILDLRKDPEVASVMAGALTQKNADYLESKLGREPSDGELYIAHFLGANGSSRLISLAENNPDARADRIFPRQARANKSIFYTESGTAKTASEVYAGLVRQHDGPSANQYAAAPTALQQVPAPVAKSVALADTAMDTPVPVAKFSTGTANVPFPVARIAPRGDEAFAFLSPSIDPSRVRLSVPDAISRDANNGKSDRQPTERWAVEKQRIAEEARQPAETPAERIASRFVVPPAVATTDALAEALNGAVAAAAAAGNDGTVKLAASELTGQTAAQVQTQAASLELSAASHSAESGLDPRERVAGAWQAAIPSTPFQALFRNDTTASREPINPAYLTAFAAQPDMGRPQAFTSKPAAGSRGTSVDTVSSVDDRVAVSRSEANVAPTFTNDGSRGPLNLMGTLRYEIFKEPEDVMPPV